MFGIGKLLGNVAGGLLEKVGLGKIAPFVKMGLNAMTGNWLGVAQDVFGLVSNFKNNFANNTSQLPPLGGFENPLSNLTSQNNPLTGNRMSDLLKGLGGLFKGLSSLIGGGGANDGAFGGLGKIFNAFRTLSEAFGNNQLFNNRASISQYTNIQA